jgi:hypothetical protein
MEMLENAIKKYHNKVLTAAEVMDELIKLSKEIISMDDEASELGLTEFEYAFDLLLTRFFLERDFNSSLSSFFNISKATFLCSMPLSSSMLFIPPLRITKVQKSLCSTIS